MPYTNVPKHLWGKMDRCVEDVMDKDPKLKKSNAIAICHSRIVKEREIEMSNARQRRKKRRAEARRKAAELLVLAEDPEADEKAEEIQEEEAQEIIESLTDDDKALDKDEKIYVRTEDGHFLAYGGAQSWEDLDEFLEAEATSSAVRQTEYEFRKMVNNILEDLNLEIDEKGEKIAALAEGFSARADETAEDKKDIEIQTDIITKILSKVGIENIAKARMTRAAINDLPDSKFAYIEPGGKKDEQGKTVPRSLRHYPIHDKAHVRNALARASQMIKRGGKAAETARKALPKIRAVAKRMGIGKSSGFKTFKDLQGNDRWFGWVSNKFRDRDFKAHPKGEIIEEVAHKEFVSWVYEDAVNRMPQLWIWHTVGTEMKERADWMDYADGFLLLSGNLTPTEAKMWKELEDQYDLAMSHGFIKIGYDDKKGIITKYRTFEGSALPRGHVANEWTNFLALQEVKDMGFTSERRKLLVDALGEDKVAELEASTKDLADELKEIGIEFKEASEDEETKTEVEEEETEVDSEEVEEEPEKALDLKAISELLGLPQLSDYLKDQSKSIEEIKLVVAELLKSDDEKVAEALKPRSEKSDLQLAWLNRLSESDETKMGDEELEKHKEKIEESKSASWVSEVFGPAPDPKSLVAK